MKKLIPRSLKLLPITTSLRRTVKVGLKCSMAGGLVNRECRISCIHAAGIITQELSIQQAAPGFGTFPIQSLACRSVVSVLAHACPVRSNLLAPCREIRLIKSLTEISSNLDLRRAKERGAHSPEKCQNHKNWVA